MTASLLLGGAILLAITVSGALLSCFSSPRKGVGGIPTIPFWVALMPLVKDVDQQDIFATYIEKPLRKHGAASIFFAGQWNVLIHKPAYLAEVFRREDIHQKSGNYSKIPHSVLAALLGDNIIWSRGETWKKYTRVIKPGLQASPNPDVLLRNARQLSTILVESQALPTDGIQGSIQRHTIACFENTYFNVDLNNKLCTRLLSARDSGQLTEKQFRDNLAVLFVAGQENPQLAILSTMYLLAKHQDIQDRLFDDLNQQPQNPPDAEYLDSLPLLTLAVHLGDAIFLPEGTYVGYNCYSTNRDPDAWGQDADAFRPSRWGCSRRDIHREYRRRRTRAEFITFHGGQRACLGEPFAVLQLKATLYTLMTSLRWRLDPTWLDRMTPRAEADQGEFLIGWAVVPKKLALAI
ncbi:Cytochrome P450-DIT2 [Metarhizium brunneum]|uniref:Cytochrome P450-DIT2 n=1 Tax=Metarhizium brunneum TaxID=500148 RepID=A0A7D5V497_9HYPO|nr:Cytochrome P450-DIT2 [Metarhizium brunneum]